MREERAASESARCGCGRKASGTAIGDRFMEANALRGCCRVAAVGRARAQQVVEREGGAPRWTSPGGTGNNPLRTKQVWPTFHREGCGRDDAERTPGAPATAAAQSFRPGRRRRGGSKRRAPVAPWLPRAGRGAVTCARCRQGTEPEKSVRPVWHNFRKPRTMVDSARSGSSVG